MPAVDRRNRTTALRPPPVGTSKHLDQAIAAARKAFESWRHSSEKERTEACQAIATVVTENAEELAVLLTKEQGKPLGGLGRTRTNGRHLGARTLRKLAGELTRDISGSQNTPT